MSTFASLSPPLSSRPTFLRPRRVDSKARKIRPTRATPVIPTAKQPNYLLSCRLFWPFPAPPAHFCTSRGKYDAASNVINSSAQDPRFWPQPGNLPVVPPLARLETVTGTNWRHFLELKHCIGIISVTKLCSPVAMFSPDLCFWQFAPFK